jgi:general secretion pathway protein D
MIPTLGDRNMAVNMASDATSPRRAQRRLPAQIVVLSVLCSLSLSGCYKSSVLPQSEGHLADKAATPAVPDVPSPARTSSFVPAPKPAVKTPTYTVVVSEVPVKELLFALARDTKQNVDIHPGLQGLVSLNAINETLPGILERISKQVNMRYRLEGQTIIVSPDVAYMKTYKVNYVNMSRETTSSIGVSGQIQSGGTGSSGASGGGGSSGGGSSSQLNASSTVVKTVSNNNFWDTLRDNIRAILTSTRNQNLSAEQRAERAETARSQREERLQQAEAVARAGAGAPQLFSSVFGNPATAAPLPTDVQNDVVVNAVSGTISVFATEKQHALVQQHIDSITQVSQRQVLIEATIAEVTLSDAYQGGIDWSRLAVTGGLNLTQTLTTGVANAFTAGSLTIGYVNPTSQLGNISASVKLLQQFGNARVLSSPKLMAINNQTALLKVVDNIVYFSIESQQGVSTGGGVIQAPTFNTTALTVPVGMVMSLTPQINDNGQVTLTARPTVTRILSFANDPNPSLCTAAIITALGKCVTNPVPQIQTREMESVLQLVSGQTAVLGGLMQDNASYARNGVPGVGNPANTGVFSELFNMRNDAITKSELVIFLRATVITNPSLESDELKFFERFLPKQSDATNVNDVLKAGAAR